MKAQEIVDAVLAKYPQAVIDEVFVKVYFGLPSEVDDIETSAKAEDHVEPLRKWMEVKGYWMETPTEIDYGVHRVPRSKLPALMEQYHCDTEEQLDDIFWYTYGVELVVEDDPVETEFHLTRDDLVVTWKRGNYVVKATTLDEAVAKVVNKEVTPTAECLLTTPIGEMPKEGVNTPTVIVSETGKEDIHIVEL